MPLTPSAGKSAAGILDMGFAGYEAINPLIDEKKITPVKVTGGVFKEIKPIVKNNSSLVIKKGAKKIEYKYDIKKSVNAPIDKNDELGSVKIICDGKTISEIKLVSPNSISKITVLAVFKDLISKI